MPKLHHTHISSTTPSDDIIYGRQALSAGEPWITPGSLAFLNLIISPTWHVFEWGSGGSTLYFGRNCASLVSVEHGQKWLNRIHARLLAENLLNVTQIYKRGLPKGTPDRFRPYADVINVYPDSSFNLIFIDGEASSRGWCIANSIPKLIPGGYLLLDNSNMFIEKNSPIWTEWERDDYIEPGLKWVGQAGTFDWWTTIFRKPGE